jgi:hypothetical protein
MTELLPSGDKVQITVASGESVEVPQGKVWKVNLSADGGNEVVIEVPSSSNPTRLPSGSTVTLHEGTAINKNIANDEALVTGWEFDYSQ